jgi:Flp pilus assembly protein TadD
MPTRIPSPTPTSVVAQPLQTLQAALRQGEDAEHTLMIWEEARILAPHNGIVWREGARLALAQDNVLSTTDSVLSTNSVLSTTNNVLPTTNSVLSSTDSVLSSTDSVLSSTDSVAIAEERIWQAIQLIPQDGETWALLGLILKRQGQFKAAMQALDVARTLDPTLGSGLFPELWQAALQAKDTQTMQTLVRTYSRQHRETPLAIYYRAETLLTLGEAEITRDLLIASMDQTSPALLWYTLGRAYMRTHAWNEAAMSLEVAKKRIASGDESLRFMDKTALKDLRLALGQAYLHAGQCAQAEQVLRDLLAEAGLVTEADSEANAPASTPTPDLAPLVRDAVICQTPTPTWTPWMISEQVIPTP